MKKIYLLSGPGTIEGFSDVISKELKKDLKGVRSIAFISSSSAKHEKNVNFLYGNEKITGLINHLKDFANFEQVNIVDDENKNLDINSDVIYLLGGNYETQLSFIKENKFDEILKNYNGILLCTSCGAMNIAEYGYYSKDEDIEKSFFYNGLGLTNITIDPHFDIENDIQVEEAKKMSFEHVIYGVPNSSCIRINNNSVEMIGKVYEFNNGNMVEHN